MVQYGVLWITKSDGGTGVNRCSLEDVYTHGALQRRKIRMDFLETRYLGSITPIKKREIVKEVEKPDCDIFILF